MSVEVLGFITGAMVAGFAWLVLLRHERWRLIRAIYDQRNRRLPAGNALIWPSR